MKKYNKFIYLTLGGIILTFLICFGIFQYYEYLSNNIVFTSPSYPAFVPPKITKQPNIKIYINREVGYKFEYPGDYILLGDMELQPDKTYDFSNQINSLNKGVDQNAARIMIDTVKVSSLPLTKTCFKDEVYGETCNSTLADFQRDKFEQDKLKVDDKLPNGGQVINKDDKGGVMQLYFSAQAGYWYVDYSLYDKNYNHIMISIGIPSEDNREKMPINATEIGVLRMISNTFKFTPVNTKLNKNSPVGFSLTNECKVVGWSGDNDPSIGNGKDYKLNDNEWLVDCGSKNNSARGVMGPILEQQGWKFCSSHTATGSWWKDGVLTAVAESAGSGYPFRIIQHKADNCE